MAPVNMGPRISMMGIADYAARQGAKKLVVVAPNNPGVEYYNNGVLDIAAMHGVEGEALTGPPVIEDAASEAQRLAQAAGPDGAVLIDYVAPETLKILQAVSQQGLIDSVFMWAAGGASNDSAMVAALGPEWEGKFPINAELSNAADTPDNQLLMQGIQDYAPVLPISSFARSRPRPGRRCTSARCATRSACSSGPASWRRTWPSRTWIARTCCSASAPAATTFPRSRPRSACSRRR
jgi:hypothetical protein